MGTAFLVISVSIAAIRNDKMKPGGTVPDPLQGLSPDLHQGEAGILFGNLKPKGMSVLQSLYLGRAFGQQTAG